MEGWVNLYYASKADLAPQKDSQNRAIQRLSLLLQLVAVARLSPGLAAASPAVAHSLSAPAHVWQALSVLSRRGFSSAGGARRAVRSASRRSAFPAGPALHRGGAVHLGIGSDLRARQQDGRGVLPRK